MYLALRASGVCVYGGGEGVIFRQTSGKYYDNDLKTAECKKKRKFAQNNIYRTKNWTQKVL